VLKQKLGICQWFHYEDRTAVESAVLHFGKLGVRHLRTDISWADASRPNGWKWYRWLYRELHSHGMQILPCVYLTPPSISENGNTNGPPQRLEDYADFIARCIDEVGQWIGPYIEHWNEPNNDIKWDQQFDPFEEGRKKQGSMLRMATKVAHQAGFKPILGGMSPIDHDWIDLMTGVGAMEYCEVVAIHAFPGMWNDTNWKGWDHMVEYFNQCFPDKPIWITEIGRATSSPEGSPDIQLECLNELALALQKHPILERAYWYSLLDLPQSKQEIEVTAGGYKEPAEHALGLVTEKGALKPAYARFKELLAQ